MSITKHRWYLSRCSCCRKLVLNSAPKCPACGLWRPSARALSIALPILATTTLLVAVILTTHALAKLDQERTHEKPVPVEQHGIPLPNNY